MSAEQQERLLKAKNISSIRSITRELHWYPVQRRKALWRNHKEFLLFLGLIVGFIAILLPFPLVAKVFIFLGGTLMIVALHSAWIRYDTRDFIKQENQYASQYEAQLLTYLEKYYGVEISKLKYSMRPVHMYMFNETKVKKIRADEFDYPSIAVDNGIINTPDITNVLYFGKLTLGGNTLNRAVVQLLPDGNIVILHDGKEVDSK
jgi:hypothetical protein